jgi:hypothetical protein
MNILSAHLNQRWVNISSFTTTLTRPKERKLKDKEDGENK